MTETKTQEERRVLVVDDEPAVRALVAASLDGAGCEVEACADGPTALQSALAAPPQLILLDVALPGLNGADLLRRLRAEPATSAIPVVMLTGLEPPAGLRPDGVLRKPFAPNDVRETVLEWLGAAT
jgi:CheY-like chemotaxis protein